MSTQTICVGTCSVTFSPVSVDGAMPSDLQDGQTMIPFGPEAVLASRFHLLESSRGLMMSGTYGPLCFGLSSSQFLQQSLESRLRANLECLGSPLYKLTWKHVAMPSGRRILQRQARVRRKSDSACTGWQTPKLPSGGGQGFRLTEGGGMRKLEDQVALTGWPAPTCPSKTGNHQSGNNRYMSLVRRLCSVGIQTGFNAETVTPGPLRAAHSRWVQGYPREWENCADSVTP